MADDRVRVTFDGKKVIDRWYDVGGQIDRSLITNVKQGDHKIQTDFYENGGQAAIFSDIVPFDHWLAYYYPNRNLEGYPVDAKIIAPQDNEKALVENSGYGSPTPKIPVDNFSARYTTVKRLPAGEYIVRGKADDSMRLFIDGKLIIDEWDTGKWDKEHARKITIQDNTASSALGSTNEKDTHLVEVQYMESINTSDVKLSIEPYKDVVQHDTWIAEYYNNKELKGDAVVVGGKNSLDKLENLEFNWGYEAPLQNISSDNFSARFTKTEEFEQGEYLFLATADDGIRVYVDDKVIIDSWKPSDDEERKVKKTISKGKHKITVEYLECTGAATLKFTSSKDVKDGINVVNKAINYPGDQKIEEKHEEIYKKQEPIRNAMLGKQTRSLTARSYNKIFWPEPGDILITTDTKPSISGFGILGHAGMVLDPMSIMHIGGPDQHPIWMPSNHWFDDYHHTILLRWKNREEARKAAQWVWDYYIKGPGKNTDYFISPNVYSKNTTYCSELVYQGFLYGAGIHLIDPTQEIVGVIAPYQFLVIPGFTAIELPY